jgi:flagellar protein FliO/FliZ
MPPGFSGADLFRMIGSMALVLIVMAVLLWVLKRMQAKMVSQVGARRLQVVESLSLNTRHKLALVRVGGHEVLVGVSPTHITALAQWSDGQTVTPDHQALVDLQDRVGATHEA